MKPPHPAHKETLALVSFLQNPTTTEETATDALVEWITARRRKGWSIYEVTLGLIEVMQKVPQTLDNSFDLARTITFLPHHTDLTPPSSGNNFTSTASSVRSKSHSKNMAVVSQTLQRYNLEQVGLGAVREVLVEWAWGMEVKIAEGESALDDGRSSTGQAGITPGGKGSIGSAGFNEIIHSFDTLSTAHLPQPVPPSLSAVLLSVRMSLGYLTVEELSAQLSTLLGLMEGERCLRIWVGRRIQGEGRYKMGEVLDGLARTEGRPALKGVVRMVRGKFLLPDEEGRWRVPLPAPGKTRVIALLKEQQAQLQTQAASQASSSSSSTSPFAGLAGYTFELVSEYITREKRDSMRSEKWIKSGRKQLGRDLDEIEDKLCLPGVSSKASGAGEGVENPGLLRVFDVLRRIHALDPVASKTSMTTGGRDFQPIDIPDWDEIYLPPTVQTVTSALYVQPPLLTIKAVDCVMELVDYEKDLRTMDVRGAMSREEDTREQPGEQGRSSEDTVMNALVWGPLEKSKMRRVLESIERRFPDGEYDEAFEIVRSKVSEGSDLARAPSYTTVASFGTAQRTDSYIRGNTHVRGSMSTSMHTESALPVLLRSTPASPSNTRSGREESLAEEPLMEVLDGEPSGSGRAPYRRTNTTPNERIPGMFGQAMRKMSLSNRELSTIASGGSPSGSPSRSQLPPPGSPPGMTHSNSQASVNTEGTLEDIYAGYGEDSIQPLGTRVEPDSASNARPPVGSPTNTLSPANAVDSAPVKPKRKGTILRRPGFFGGNKTDKTDKAGSENTSSILNRSSTRHRPSKSLSSDVQNRTAAVAAIMNGTSTPPRAVQEQTHAVNPSDSPSSSTSSPAGWRAEFNNMNNGMGMLRPSPKHSTSTGSTGLARSATTARPR